MEKIRQLLLLTFVACFSALSADDGQWEVVKMSHDVSRLYLGTKAHGVIIVDKESGKQTLLSKENGLLQENYIRDIKVSGSQVAFLETRVGYSNPSWVEFMEDGQIGKSVEVKAPASSVPNELAGSFGLWLYPCIAFDGTGSLWLTILDSWVCRCEGETFTDFAKVTVNRGQNNMVSDMVFDDKGALWLANGYPDSLLCKYADGKVEKFDLAGSALCIAINSNGDKWLGGQLAKYDDKEMVFYKGAGIVYDIEIDGEGRVWVMEEDRLLRFLGSEGEGFDHATTPAGRPYHYETGRFEQIRIPTASLNSIHADGNLLYVASRQGMFIVDATTGEYRNMQVPLPGDASGISSTTGLPALQTPVHDLQGRRVGDVRKGVYIQNGRKVIR